MSWLYGSVFYSNLSVNTILISDPFFLYVALCLLRFRSVLGFDVVVGYESYLL